MEAPSSTNVKSIAAAGGG